MGFIEIEKGKIRNFTSVIRINREQNIVEKIVDYKHYSKELYEREVYWLNKLSDSGVTPKLLNCDPKTNTITMEWCGELLCEENKPDDVYEQLYNISITLLKNNCFYNDWKAGNFLIRNGKIKIIDFGWCPKAIEDYSCNNSVDTELVEKPGENAFENIFNY